MEGPAIGRAGSLLAGDGPTPPGSRGQAEILNPPTNRPGESARGRASAASNGTGTGSDASGTTGKKRSRRSGVSAVRPNLTVMIVNESGNPSAAENYRAVLSSVGYEVVSVSERSNSSPGSRQTVVSYMPGKAAQAKALAGRLPGSKAVVASGEILPAEAVVIIR
jgi:hypothetical protein